MSPAELTQGLRTEGERLGLDALGVTPAVTPAGHAHYLSWLDQGHAAGMAYMEREPALRADPGRVLEGACSVVVASLVYDHRTETAGSPALGQGKIARYARGLDYHQVMRQKLGRLLDWLEAKRPGIRGRVVVDTAPFLERDFARSAGLGWIAKNTMLINRRLGSYTFLGAILVDLELAYDQPHEANHCGTCTRCLDACPTQAFTGPYELDAGRCISYWTIEHKGPMPDAAAESLHGWAFGCDVCQEVCPWNRKAAPGREPAFEPRPEWTDPDLIEWLVRDPAAWRALLADSALERSKRKGLVRNAALILGSKRVQAAVIPLAGLLDDALEHPSIRASAAWALGRIQTSEALASLDRHRGDPDPLVQEAVLSAMAADEKRRVGEAALSSPTPCVASQGDQLPGGE